MQDVAQAGRPRIDTYEDTLGVATALKRGDTDATIYQASSFDPDLKPLSDSPTLLVGEARTTIARISVFIAGLGGLAGGLTAILSVTNVFRRRETS